MFAVGSYVDKGLESPIYYLAQYGTTRVESGEEGVWQFQLWVGLVAVLLGIAGMIFVRYAHRLPRWVFIVLQLLTFVSLFKICLWILAPNSRLCRWHDAVFRVGVTSSVALTSFVWLLLSPEFFLSTARITDTGIQVQTGLWWAPENRFFAFSEMKSIRYFAYRKHGVYIFEYRCTRKDGSYFDIPDDPFLRAARDEILEKAREAKVQVID